MRIFRDLNSLPAFSQTVITIGTFDGVHAGHQRLIERIKLLSTSQNSESIILTFHPHPRLVIEPNATLRLLNTLDEKLELLERYGVDNVVVVPFSRDFSNQSAADYVQYFLVEKFHPRCIVIGYDHHFGKDRAGNYLLLEQMKTVYNYELQEIAKETLDDIAISSTKIRNALNSGEIKAANQLLGHPFTITGTVVKGQQNGRKIGFPTANIQVQEEHKLIPLNGVYAVFVLVAGQRFRGMLNIGIRPTLNGLHLTIEVNIMEFDKDIYGETIQVELMDYIRPEQKFSSLDELKQQIGRDKVQIQDILATFA